MAYSGSSTGNMTGNNDAASVGLSATDWSVVANKGGNNNFPGLNKAGQIRLYGSSSNHNVITVTSSVGTISSIVVTYGTSNYNALVKVGSTTITGTGSTNTEKTYAINSTSFSIAHNYNSTTQVYIISIVINYGSSCTAPTITNDLSETEVVYTKGATANALSITATGTDVTYQWYSNTTKSTTGATKLTGQTSSSYTPSTTTTGTKYYYCVASSSTCTTNSKFAKITVNEPSYTITATKNDASLGNVSLSGKVITATPNACVGYADLAYTVTSGSATVSQSGNNFTVTPSSNCTICINFAELDKDTYVDNLHGNADIEECGSYEAPSLPDAAKATTGNCDVVHYHFAGWVTRTISTGTPGAPSGMITAGTNMTSNGATYIAVWAKEQ